MIPASEDSLVLRADFSDDRAWTEVRSAIAAPEGPFRARVRFIEDRDHDGLTVGRLLTLVPGDSNRTFIFLVDRETLTRPDHPVLVVDLHTEPGRTFRVIPSEMWGVENNLALGNMDWEDFADSVDRDGVFRGYDD